MHFSQLSLFCVRYHGAIPRSHAESLLKNDGEFLIRDSSTGQPGDLVLSTFFGGYLHFMINKVKRMLTKELGEPVVHFDDLTSFSLDLNEFLFLFTIQVVIQPNTVYQSTQYKLEEEPFESISDLVTCYVGSGKAVTAATGAKITTPINRTKPLSVYSSRYSVDSRSCHPSSTIGSSQYGGSSNLYSGRSPLTPAVAGRVRMVHPTAREYSTQSLPRSTQSASNRVMMRRGPSDPSLSGQQGASLAPACPPKPSRIPSQIYQSQDDVDSIPPSTIDSPVPQVPLPLNRISESVGQDEVQEEEENNEEVDVLPQLPQLPATLPRRRAAGNLAKRPISMTRNSFLDRRSCDFDVEAAFNQPHLINNSDDQSNVNDEHPSSLHREFPTLFDVENFRVIIAIDNSFMLFAFSLIYT